MAKNQGKGGKRAGERVPMLQGDALEAARMAAEITVKELCERVGIDKSLWYRWRSGKVTTATVETARALATALHIDLATVGDMQDKAGRLLAAFIKVYMRSQSDAGVW